MADEYLDTPADEFKSTPDDTWVAAADASAAPAADTTISTKVMVRFVSPDTFTHPFQHYF